MFFMFFPFVFSWLHFVLLSVVYTVARELALVKPPYKQRTMPLGQENTNGVFLFLSKPITLKRQAAAMQSSQTDTVHSSVCVFGQLTRNSFSVARVNAVYSQWM